MKIGTRVQVNMGDGVTPQGKGTYQGEVAVYYILMPDGSLHSKQDAEERPTIEEIEAANGKLITSPGNPKIVLDNGDVVYGCQVWWEPIKDQSVN
jgi:hypothetical protein